MKRFLTFIAAALSAGILSAQEVKYHDASDLTVIGTPIPTLKDFTRIDTSAYRFNDKVMSYIVDHREQSIEGMVESIGLPPCKVCTYCWNGKG